MVTMISPPLPCTLLTAPSQSSYFGGVGVCNDFIILYKEMFDVGEVGDWRMGVREARKVGERVGGCSDGGIRGYRVL